MTHNRNWIRSGTRIADAVPEASGVSTEAEQRYLSRTVIELHWSSLAMTVDRTSVSKACWGRFCHTL